jgi:hypothetical protein
MRSKSNLNILAMKRKKININEALLLTKAEEAQVRGGKRDRVKYEDGTKVKIIW